MQVNDSLTLLAVLSDLRTGSSLSRQHSWHNASVAYRRRHGFTW